MMQHFIFALKNYATFSGRASRTQYWMFYLFWFIFTVVCSFIDSFLGEPIFTVIFYLGTLLPYLAATSRRLHVTSSARHGAQWLVAAYCFSASHRIYLVDHFVSAR